jgi:hypothetical protein
MKRRGNLKEVEEREDINCFKQERVLSNKTERCRV